MLTRFFFFRHKLLYFLSKNASPDYLNHSDDKSFLLLHF